MAQERLYREVFDEEGKIIEGHIETTKTHESTTIPPKILSISKELKEYFRTLERSNDLTKSQKKVALILESDWPLKAENLEELQKLEDLMGEGSISVRSFEKKIQVCVNVSAKLGELLELTSFPTEIRTLIINNPVLDDWVRNRLNLIQENPEEVDDTINIDPFYSDWEIHEHEQTLSAAQIAETLLHSPQLSNLSELILANHQLKSSLRLLAKTPHLKSLQKLSLESSDTDDDALYYLLNSRYIKNLKHLDLSSSKVKDFCSVSDEIAANLEELDLSNTCLTNSGLSRLAKLPNLRVLNLSKTNISSQSLELIATSKNFSKLEELNFDDCAEITAEGIEALANSTTLTNLKTISFRGIYNSQTGYIPIKTILELEKLPNLEHLETSLNPQNDEEFQQILESKLLAPHAAESIQTDAHLKAFLEHPNTTPLKSDCPALRKITNQGLQMLADSPKALTLKELNLEGEIFTDSSLAIIANSPYFCNLKILDLPGSLITSTGIKALAESEHLKKLQDLDASLPSLGNEALVLIANSPNFANLEILRLTDCNIDDQGAIALTNSPYLKNLRLLDISGTDVTHRGILALEHSSHLQDLKVRSLKIQRELSDEEVIELQALIFPSQASDIT